MAALTAAVMVLAYEMATPHMARPEMQPLAHANMARRAHVRLGGADDGDDDVDEADGEVGGADCCDGDGGGAVLRTVVMAAIVCAPGTKPPMPITPLNLHRR